MRDLAQRIFTIIKEPHLAGFATIAEESKTWVRYVTCHGSKDLTVRFSEPVMAPRAKNAFWYCSTLSPGGNFYLLPETYLADASSRH
jgi:hypothetical protein